MVWLALDAQTASQSGPIYCLKKIIPRSPQLAAAGSLQKTWAPPSVAALVAPRGGPCPCFALMDITISPLRLLVPRVAFVRCLDSAIRKHEGVP